ncbi:TPA: hypothetical protein DCW38_03595 [candidate division WOR-3 bacterium]|jgi:PTH1 family peptidyl-tRNA hydrolase|uniref:Peptidyl-tRNA hydrolase n=1 Tax=candidate division WOR-3 bacterium TaxID=2052148 RepID=A0A350H9N0_UNCW3|nr:hypothetical protein [candidate division WOR-3 bacterium]
MITFVGLGNIGSKYSNTRHNIGFMALDLFVARHKGSFKPGKGEFFFAIVL